LEITGFVDPRRAAMALRAADISVVPNRAAPVISARYTSPLKIFEAMAVGVPLVCSDLPSMRDVLDDSTALFVPPEDPAALAEALRDLLGNDSRMRALGEALHARAPEHTWDARAQRVLDWMGAQA
jgi:glycosyltransferase involved in cell wall biosynthesis